MTLPEVYKDVLRKLYIEQPETAPAGITQDVLQAINAACQMLNTAGDPFWRVSTIERTFLNDDGQVIAAAQSVESVVSAASRPLFRVRKPEECKFAHEMFLGQSAPVGDYDPIVYCVAAVANPATGGFDLTLYLGPQPLANPTDVSVDYIERFQNYVTADLSDETKVISVPNDYIETVLLPVARYFATSSHFFANKEGLPILQSDYQAARAILMKNNPEIDTITDHNRVDRAPEPERA